jgi:hypothetical protein
MKKLSSLAISKAIQAWSTPETSGIVINEKLCTAFAEILDDILSKPWLGNATTKELLDELQARADVHGYANYKTVGDD